MTTTTDLEATAQQEAQRVFGILAHVRTVESAEMGWVAAVVFGEAVTHGSIQWSIFGGTSHEDALDRCVKALAFSPSLDGTPSRAMIERHFTEHGGHWLVSRVRHNGAYRPMVLRMSFDPHGTRYVWLRATIPGTDYGGVWGEEPFRSMTGSKFTPLTADGEACECGRGR